MKTEEQHLKDKLEMANIIGYCIGQLKAHHAYYAGPEAIEKSYLEIERQFKEFLDNFNKKQYDI